MGDLETFARETFQEVAGNRIGRRIADRVHQAVELIPGLAEVGEEGVDLFIAADVAIENQLGVEFFRELGDAVLETLADIGERQFRAFALARLGDAVGDGTIR